jgi:hypothetical protein
MRKPFSLYAYPRGPRRDEVLDTLLMAAEAGHRPRAWNLFRHGLRARLGRPRGRGVVVLAVLVAVVAGFFAAALAHQLAWRAVPDLPGTAQRARLAQLIAPGMPVTWEYWAPDDPSQAGAPFATVAGELTSRRYGGTVPSTPETRDVASFTAGLRERLAAAGWQVRFDHSDRGPDRAADDRIIRARDDRLVLAFEAYRAAKDADSWVWFSVYRTEPPWVAAATIATGLAGAAAGWLLFGWASRRLEGRRVVGAVASLAAVAGLLLVAPAFLLGIGYPYEAATGYLPDSAFWAGLTPSDDLGGLAVPAEVMFAAALLIAAAFRPPRPAEQPATP